MVVMLAIAACAKSPTPETGTPEPATPEATTPATQAPPLKGQVLVQQLPDTLEGLEVREGALAVKDGYKFEKQPGGGFTIARMSDGATVTSGGCGCRTGSSELCDPLMEGGIIICVGFCNDCGLAAWPTASPNTRTELMRFTK
jgi:hypothetical protein